MENTTSLTTPIPESLLTAKHPILCKLQDRVLRLDGPDAAKFLQGQVTCDVRTISESHAAFGAICSPKGRLIAQFYALQRSPSQPDLAELFIHASEESIPRLTQHLTKYMLFSKARLTPHESLKVVGIYWPEANNLVTTNLNKTLALAVFGNVQLVRIHKQLPLFLAYGQEEDLTSWTQTLPAETIIKPHSFWENLEVVFGIPRITDAHSEEFVPQSLNMVAFEGISFSKGCYTGQEVIARIKYLGKEKKRLCQLVCDSGEMKGTKLSDQILDQGGQKVGTLISASNAFPYTYLLAVISKSESAANSIYYVEGLENFPFKEQLLPYLEIDSPAPEKKSQIPSST